MARLLKRALRQLVNDFMGTNELYSRARYYPTEYGWECNIWMLLLSRVVFNSTGVHGLLCAIQGAIGWRARAFIWLYCWGLFMRLLFNQVRCLYMLLYDYYVVANNEKGTVGTFYVFPNFY